jgi:low affinity Fe/Cu permease
MQDMKEKLYKIFTVFSNKVSDIIGSPPMFIVAVMFIVLWLLSGPIFKFSDTWQLIINTSTTIITFLTVFLIQNTQNRNDKATQLKLDEIIHSIKTARNDFIDIEELDDKELKTLRKEYSKYKKLNPARSIKKKK